MRRRSRTSCTQQIHYYLYVICINKTFQLPQPLLMYLTISWIKLCKKYQSQLLCQFSHHKTFFRVMNIQKIYWKCCTHFKIRINVSCIIGEPPSLIKHSLIQIILKHSVTFCSKLVKNTKKKFYFLKIFSCVPVLKVSKCAKINSILMLLVPKVIVSPPLRF